MPPTQRLRLRIGELSAAPARRCSSAGLGALHQLPVERVLEHRRRRLRRGGAARPSASSMWVRMCVRSTPRAFQCSIASPAPSRSTRPIASSSERRPSDARISRTSSATKKKKLTTCSGVPLKRLRSSGSCVAMPDRAGVQVAGAHHDAAGRDQRRGREAHLVGAEHRRDHHVAAGLQLAVGLHDDARAQVVEQQRLLGLGEADLPRHAGRLDRGQRRGAGAAVVAGDQHAVGVGLRRRPRRPCRRRPRRRA